MNDKMGIRGCLEILKFENEKLIEKYFYKNLVTVDGFNYLLKLIANDKANGINKLAIGDGNRPASVNDKSLENKLLLLDVQKDYSIANRVNFMVNIPANTFNTIVNYKEAGLTVKTQTEEILITRLVFNDVIYQKPENSLSLLYSLEMRA